MTDPLRSDRPALSADPLERDRDARVEQLLLAGLDHYFAGHYERAISVWTRVLFLNHGHARARAYMERARGAIAERQRESEELLHIGVEAFGRGDIVTARGFLTSAVDRGAGNEEALALLDRLNRLDRAVASPGRVLMRAEPALLLPGATTSAHAAVKPSRVRWVAGGVLAGAMVVGAAGWLWRLGPERRLGPARAPLAHDAEPLPVPSAAGTALAQAQLLQTRGRLHDALGALDRVRYGDSVWPEAQGLRTEIQRQLLAGAGTPVVVPDSARAGVRP